MVDARMVFFRADSLPLLGVLAVACILIQARARGQTEHLKVLGYAPSLSAVDLENDSIQAVPLSRGSFQFSNNFNASLLVFVSDWLPTTENATACVRLVDSNLTCSSTGQDSEPLIVELDPVQTPPTAQRFSHQKRPANNKLAETVLPFPAWGIHGPRVFYFCTPPLDQINSCNGTTPLEHQGAFPWLAVNVKPLNASVNTDSRTGFELPLAGRIVILIVLHALSAIYSGQNIGLFSQNLEMLKNERESETKWKRCFAKCIYCVRWPFDGYYLFCAILLMNVAVNSSISILLDDLISGIPAVVCFTLGMVIVREIILQSLFKKWDFCLGGITIPFAWFSMLVTLPPSFLLGAIIWGILKVGKEVMRFICQKWANRSRTDTQEPATDMNTIAVEPNHSDGAPLSVSEFLDEHETEFFTVVNPRQSLLRLTSKGVITESVKHSIDIANTKDAVEILYYHLKYQANVNTLLEYCEMAIDADDFPNMQSFGRRMKEELQQRGLLESRWTGF